MDVTTRHDYTTEFSAMGSPCAVIVSTDDENLAVRMAAVVREEALRVEKKFTRYLPSLITTINQTSGARVKLDEETADLVDYAHRCYLISDGKFDITSGALRRVWRFDGKGEIPDARAIAAVLPYVGWGKVTWERPYLTLREGMEIDLGGIGKEYAVDRALGLAMNEGAAGILVNFGGDLRASGSRIDGSGWHVAIESVQEPGTGDALLALNRGALATSGDAHRVVLHEGRRFGHVLDPRSGWPIAQAPRSVTVLADSCSEAGLLAKLALLSGAHAEQFLRDEKVRAWVAR